MAEGRGGEGGRSDEGRVVSVLASIYGLSWFFVFISGTSSRLRGGLASR